MLRETIGRYAAPEVLVNGSRSDFKAIAARVIYQALGVDKRQVVAGEPRQKRVETQFGTLRACLDSRVRRGCWGATTVSGATPPTSTASSVCAPVGADRQRSVHFHH